MANSNTDYDKVIVLLFDKKYKENIEKSEIYFTKDELAQIASELGITIRNIPDVIYTYRCRRELPNGITSLGNWSIMPKGKGKFAFIKMDRSPFIEVQQGLAPIEILNALPEIVEKYTANDEQGILSSIRYNRLVDIFTEITCFHLQSHIRTTIEGEGQIEIDDLYVGIDQDGKEFILPIEAKSSEDRDKLGWVQISNLVKFSTQFFPLLTCKPLAVKPIDKATIYMLEFEAKTDFEEVGIKNIKLYKLTRKDH